MAVDKKKPASPEKKQTKKTDKKKPRKAQTKKTTDTATQKKRKRTSKKKKNGKGTLIFALSVLCIVLLGFNIAMLYRFKNDTAEQPAHAVEKKETKPVIAKDQPEVQPTKNTQKQTIKKQQNTPPPVKKGATAKEHTQKQPVQPKKQQKKKLSSRPKKAIQPEPVAKTPKPVKPHKKAGSAGTLIFVFDDAGHNLRQLDYFLHLPFACCIAILPRLPYSPEAARRIRNAGKEAMLHQPMQAVNPAINPGKGAIKPGLSATEIKAITRKNLEEIWPVAGMNNHEGSLITADTDAMSAVLDVVREKNIFFLDSRTTAKTVVPQVAKEKNMKIWQRAVFLDNKKTRSAMKKEIEKGLAIARKKGYAIMIGHVCTIELAKLLTDMYPDLIREGFAFSTITNAAQKGL